MIKTQISHLWSMPSEVIEGHIRLYFILKIFFCLKSTSSKRFKNAYIIKTKFYIKRSVTLKVIEGQLRH